jgi:putative phosphoesterase
MVRGTMRIAVLSDVHSNLPALRAVLADVDEARPTEIWCAGDLVGYNPWPNEVLEVLRGRRVRAIRGNHDRAVLSGDASWFNALAAEAVRWTRIHMAPAGVGYLKGLEDRTRASVADGTIAMYHGSPRNDDEYVLPWNASEEVVLRAGADIVILGHTHLPMALRFPSGLLVNPGSVGQPRDGDPRAAWGLLDTAARSFDVRRVPYDVDAVANEIRRVGLPGELADRLHAGA